MCATREGPYQSPAFLPELCPSSTSRCRPKGAWGWSANQDTICRCRRSCSSSGVPWAQRGGIQRAGPRYRLGEANPDGSEGLGAEPSAHVQSGGDGVQSQRVPVGQGGTVPMCSCFLYNSNAPVTPGLPTIFTFLQLILSTLTPPKNVLCTQSHIPLSLVYKQF